MFITIIFSANNLYGSAQTLPMPKGKFKWISETQKETMQKFFNHRHKKFKNKQKMLDWREFFEDEGKGYFIKVDMEYPDYLHEKHKDFPLAPENCVIDTEALTHKQKHIIKWNRMSKDSAGGVKLMNNLSNRKVRHW